MGIGLKDGGCPFETVPILRTDKVLAYDHYMPRQETISLQDDPHQLDHCARKISPHPPKKKIEMKKL